jgi:hypothetical protein
MAIQDNTYVLIKGFYADCPTCDSIIDDPEFIKTEIVQGEDLIEHLCNELNKYDDVAHLKLYKILDSGRLHFACDFEPITGFHCLVGIKFRLNGHDYEIVKFKGIFQLKTGAMKVLYGSNT